MKEGVFHSILNSLHNCIICRQGYLSCHSQMHRVNQLVGILLHKLHLYTKSWHSPLRYTLKVHLKGNLGPGRTPPVSGLHQVMKMMHEGEAREHAPADGPTVLD